MKYTLIKIILVFLSFLSFLKADHKDVLIQEKRIYKSIPSLDLNKSISKSVIPSYVLMNKKRVSYIDSETKDINKFQKVKLIDVVLESISNSDLLKAAREKVVQTKLRHENAKSGFYPTLKAQYSMSRTRHTPGKEGKAGVNAEESEPDHKYEYWQDRSYKITLKQNLFAGGANYYDIKSIYEKLEVAKNQYKITLNDEIKKATNAYFGVVFSNRAVIVNERNFKKLNKILQITTIKYESGALSLGDITSIKANVANAKTKLLKVKSKFLQAIKYYEYIVGINFVKTLPYEKNFDIDFPDFDSLYKRSLAQNKNLINYYKSISAEKYRLKNAKAIFSPTLDFTLSYERLLENKDFEKDSFEQTGDLVGELKLSYNIYNGGVDKNKVLKSLSIIRELNYKLNEEIRKIKWNLSKLYTSVSSVKEALKSNTNEVISSREMVRANWESFELGEKDLQTLIQGQRQLNKAELELVHHEKSFANDLFTVLDLSGDLSSFFDLDPTKSKFIDFNKSYYKKITYIKTDNTKLELKKQKDLNVILENKEKDKTTIEKKSTLDNIKEFIDKFLKFEENTYILEISSFDNIYAAVEFININEIDEISFPYDVLNNYKISTRIAYSNYKTFEEAQLDLKILSEKHLSKMFTIKKVKYINELYLKYISGLNIKKEKTVEIVKVIEKTLEIEKKLYVSNPSFKKKFLSTNDNFYTINIASFTSLNKLSLVNKKLNIENSSLFFNYGDSSKLIKLVYGVFPTYEDANIELKKIKGDYFPVIEKIKFVKKLYYSNLDINKEIKTKSKMIIKTKKYKRLKNTTNDFSKTFMSSPENHYSIYLVSFTSIDLAEKFRKDHKIVNNSLLVKSIESNIYVMYGLYSTYKEAEDALSNLSDKLRINKPFIQKLKRAQVFFRNNGFIK